MNIWLALLTGVAFGYVLYVAGALDYGNILKALRVTDLHIPKFMFFSIAVSAVGIYLLSALMGFEVPHLAFHLGVPVGGLLFGVGFALAGYCPGTVIGALGTGKRDARPVLWGAVTGTFVYALLHKTLKPLLIDRVALGEVTIDGLLGWSPLVTAVAFALAITGFLVWLDWTGFARPPGQEG